MKTVSPHSKNCETFTSFVFAALSCEISSGILKEKFHISVTLCIIFYLNYCIKIFAGKVCHLRSTMRHSAHALHMDSKRKEKVVCTCITSKNFNSQTHAVQPALGVDPQIASQNRLGEEIEL